MNRSIARAIENCGSTQVPQESPVNRVLSELGVEMQRLREVAMEVERRLDGVLLPANPESCGKPCQPDSEQRSGLECRVVGLGEELSRVTGHLTNVLNRLRL